eukprot:1795663-Rhodomonas_salina.1
MISFASATTYMPCEDRMQDPMTIRLGGIIIFSQTVLYSTPSLIGRSTSGGPSSGSGRCSSGGVN